MKYGAQLDKREKKHAHEGEKSGDIMEKSPDDLWDDRLKRVS